MQIERTPPFSRKRIDALGVRLSSGEGLSEEESKQLESILIFYQHLADTVTSRLRLQLSLPCTSRVKTRGTTVEKLLRDPATKLSRIHDFAGVRVVIEGNRVQQDRVKSRIVAEFSNEQRAPQVIDRRDRPSHGYRAVHIVVYPQNFPVEIQIRTEVQDQWAQIFENIADQWGRQIRYGDHPSDPSRTIRIPPIADSKASLRTQRVTKGVNGTRQQAIGLLQILSEIINSMERAETAVDRLSSELETYEALAGSLEGVGDILRKYEQAPAHAKSQAAEAKYLEFESHLSMGYDHLRQDAIQSLCRSVSDRRVRGRIIRRTLKKSKALSTPQIFHRSLDLVNTKRSDLAHLLAELEQMRYDMRLLLDFIAGIEDEGEPK